MALDVAGSLDPREVIARILERGTHAVQADRGTLSSIVGDLIVVEATYGRAGELTWVGLRYSLSYFEGQPLVQKAINTLHDVVETAQRKTEEAKALADELLTVAGLEGKALTPRADRVSVRDAVDQAVARARPRAELVRASSQMEDGGDLAMLADEALLGKSSTTCSITR